MSALYGAKPPGLMPDTGAFLPETPKLRHGHSFTEPSQALRVLTDVSGKISVLNGK